MVGQQGLEPRTGRLRDRGLKEVSFAATLKALGLNKEQHYT